MGLDDGTWELEQPSHQSQQAQAMAGVPGENTGCSRIPLPFALGPLCQEGQRRPSEEQRTILSTWLRDAKFTDG